MKALEQAPDAVRDRFAAWRKARTAPGTTEESQFALAMSGFVVGSEAAVAELKTADVLWQARDLVRDYLGGKRGRGARRPGRQAGRPRLARRRRRPPRADRKLDLVTRMVLLMPPPLHDPADEAEKTIVHKVDRGAERGAHRVRRSAAAGVSSAPILSRDRRPARRARGRSRPSRPGPPRPPAGATS